MSDQTPGTDTTGQSQPGSDTTGQQTAATDTRQPGPIPYERFSEVNENLKATRTELEELRAWRDEQEQAKLSEIERVQKAADEASQGRTAAETRAVEAERRLDIWKAANTAGFDDPDDAVVWLRDQVAALDDPAKIKAAVDKLAETKPKLLRDSGTPARPAPIGGLTPPTPTGEVPTGPDGKPDMKAGLGRDLLSGLLGR